jgi:hypothetical protein
MRFELSRTTASFGILNLRVEKNKGHACDLAFEVTVGADLLSMLVPAQEEDHGEGAENVVPIVSEDRLVAELYSEEGYVRRPAISPLHVNRKPEGVTVTIWDQDEDGPVTDPLILKPCSFKSVKGALQSPHQLVLSGLIQYPLYTDEELVRLNAIMDTTHDIAWVVEQSDLFDESVGGATAEDENKQAQE